MNVELICIECRRRFATADAARAHTDPLVNVTWKDGQKVRVTPVVLPWKKHVTFPVSGRSS